MNIDKEKVKIKRERKLNYNAQENEICAALISCKNIQLNQRFPIGPLSTIAAIDG